MTTTDTNATKLVPFKEGLALLLDPDVLRQVGIDESTPVDVTTDGRSIRITAAVSRPSEEDLNKTLDRVNAKWGAVLKKLAE